MRIRNSFWAVLGRDSADSHDVALERVRAAMLKVLDEFGDNETSSLETKISNAREIAELWHFRPDLMHRVAAARGEGVASECMVQVTALFKKHHLGGVSRR
jgi:cytosine/adenosine deaminase-related metal-dependent hydrolase